MFTQIYRFTQGWIK